MISWTEMQTLYKRLTKNDSTENVALGKGLMNTAIRELINAAPRDFVQDLFTSTTTAGTQFYNLPVNYRKIISMPYVTVGSQRRVIKEAPSREFWDKLNQTSYSSDYPEYFIIFEKQIGIFPTPSTSSYVITVPYEKQQKDLTLEDYTTGSITTLAASGTAVTGSGTTWNASMVGRYIRITSSNAANVGDGEWYEISAVGSTTTLTLAIPYSGTAISAGSAAYTIGQMSLLPDGYNELPVYRAASIYWATNDDKELATIYGTIWEEGKMNMMSDRGSKTSNVAITTDPMKLTNPNLFISY